MLIQARVEAELFLIGCKLSALSFQSHPMPTDFSSSCLTGSTVAPESLPVQTGRKTDVDIPKIIKIISRLKQNPSVSPFYKGRLPLPHFSGFLVYKGGEDL
jgi:hypothetical protein